MEDAWLGSRPNHYEVLDEREIASGLKDWLVGKDKWTFCKLRTFERS